MKTTKLINLTPFFLYFQRGKSSVVTNQSQEIFLHRKFRILVGAIMAFFDQISVGLLLSLLIFNLPG